jgi:hypothetical protein
LHVYCSRCATGVITSSRAADHAASGPNQTGSKAESQLGFFAFSTHMRNTRTATSLLFHRPIPAHVSSVLADSGSGGLPFWDSSSLASTYAFPGLAEPLGVRRSGWTEQALIASLASNVENIL